MTLVFHLLFALSMLVLFCIFTQGVQWSCSVQGGISVNYDLIIIGAGPGGIFAAYELMQLKPELKVAVFEAGHELSKRNCPIDGEKVKSCIGCKTCSIMSGFGGAGAFSDGKYNIISLGEYMTLAPVLPKFGAPAVGIVYAEGQVFDGEGEDDNIYSVNVSETLRKAREDKSIKAVVFRVNSPGGSALASDVIWREVELLRKEKPVIVSMGSYTASGGYYISAGADAIIADKLTLTGSIGVFGMLLEGEDMLKNRLGISTDVVKSGSSADFGTGIMGIGIRKFTEAERKVFIRSVDKVYDTFTSRVSVGRNLPMDKVLDLAQGRVWSGTRAVSLGLADANGGLREAIAVAVDKAGIADNFRVTEVLEEISPMAQVMQSLNMKVKSYLLDNETMEAVEYYNSLKREVAREGIQAYCPYSVSIQ